MDSMGEIREQIVTLNKWQYDPNYRIGVGGKFRDLYLLLVERYLAKDISLSISGLRRVGKTTILFQLINYLLESRADGKHILYYQFSEKIKNLEQVLQIFFANFTSEEVGRDNFYIFLDELQYVRDWQSIVKSYIDQNKRIKFVVSGSASIYFRSRVKESLAGRMLDFTLHPLNFAEMLNLAHNFRGKYTFSKIVIDSDNKTGDLKKLQHERSPYQKWLSKYLAYGEFPALLPYLDDEVYCRKYLREGVLAKILQKDIQLFEVEKEAEISALYRINCSNMAQMMNLTNVATETGLSYPTIKKYTLVLQRTYLIENVVNRLRSVRAQVKALDKTFVTSINLAAATLAIDEPLNPPYSDFRGHIIENFVYNSVKQLGQIYYYNKAGKEVDLILETGNKIIPIEVKSAVKLKKTDTNHLFNYMQKNKLDEGYLVYGGEVGRIEDDGRMIYLVPYWLL